MRRSLLLVLFLSAGCLSGRALSGRDDGLLREIARQDRWTQQAVEARPSSEQLEQIRSSEYEAVGRGRKQLARLVQAASRGTWVREATADLLQEEDDLNLRQDFDDAGRLRGQALQIADELAQALAEANGGLSIADLKPAFAALEKARQSEDKLARLPAKWSGHKLAAAPLPAGPLFVSASARTLEGAGDVTRELDQLPAAEATKVRARLADAELERTKAQQGKPAGKPAEARAPSAPDPGPAAAGAPASGARGGTAQPPAAEVQAEAPSDTLTIAGDAAGLFAKKGLPRSITLRSDGLFSLTWTDGVSVVDPQGKLVREEPPAKSDGGTNSEPAPKR